MTVDEFLNHTLYINLLLKGFPGAITANMLDETKLQNIIFTGMPKAWCNTFIDSR